MAILGQLAAQAAVFQALLLGAAACHKGGGRARARRAVQRFAGVPDVHAGAVLGGVVAAEAAAAVLLLMPPYRTAGALLAAGLWTGYLALIVRAIAHNRRDVDCGCSFGAGQRALGAVEVVRNALLALVALGIAAFSARLGALAPDASQLLAAAALLALYAASDQVMGLPTLRRGALR